MPPKKKVNKATDEPAAGDKPAAGETQPKPIEKSEPAAEPKK
jgi:hypothetical protein